jgi:phospholipase/lecithinase/hemolysin
MGRMSNGPVAVEDLAQNLGLSLVDNAWIGATTGVGNIVDGGTQTTFGFAQLPGMLTQLTFNQGSLSPNSLVVVWGGANDFLSNGFSAQTAVTAVDDLIAIVAQLQGIGVMHIIVPGMPDLGLTPDYLGNAQATALSVYFNQLLIAGLPRGAVYVNTFALMHEIVANPSQFGLTDVTDPCYNVTAQTLCTDPNQYLFFDGFHPTAAGHEIFAQYIAQTAVPEPSTLLMIGSGVLGLAGIARRRMMQL